MLLCNRSSMPRSNCAVERIALLRRPQCGDGALGAVQDCFEIPALGRRVEQRDLEQWFFAMSRYAQRLLDGHKKLEGKWPDRVLKMQQEWIGRSEGAEIDFDLVFQDSVSYKSVAQASASGISNSEFRVPKQTTLQ